MEPIEWVEIEEDGVVHLYHPDTGEYAGPKSKWLAPEVTNDEELLAVLRALADVKSKQVGVQSKYNLLIKQQERELKRLQNREAWLLQTYQNQLGRYAESTLPRKADGSLRVKTLTTPWGDVAIRQSKAKVSVAHEEAAANWAHTHCPESIKVKTSVLVSLIPESYKQEMIESPSFATLYGFEVTPEETKYVIKTVGMDE
jgi:hypothetical protein